MGALMSRYQEGMGCQAARGKTAERDFSKYKK
jgi:hypothetical protein